MKRFDNRTVIVTGSARGMGASFARGFVGEGANVVIADILDQEGRTLADELGEHYASTLSSCARMARWGPSAKSALVAKSGAEGYFCVGHADGLGLALKTIDADPAARARNLSTVVAIRRAGWISDADLNGALRAFGPRVPIFQSGWPLQKARSAARPVLDLSSPGFARELLAGRRCRRVLPGSVAAPDPLHVRSHGSDRAHSRPALQPRCS